MTNLNVATHKGKSLRLQVYMYSRLLSHEQIIQRVLADQWQGVVHSIEQVWNCGTNHWDQKLHNNSLEINLLSRNFFENLAQLTFMIWTLQKWHKKWSSHACLCISKFLKWGIFTGCMLKNSNCPQTGSSLGYLKDANFFLKVIKKVFLFTRAVLLYLSLIWLPGCGNITLFWTVA